MKSQTLSQEYEVVSKFQPEDKMPVLGRQALTSLNYGDKPDENLKDNAEESDWPKFIIIAERIQVRPTERV